jgi:putative membrane protein
MAGGSGGCCTPRRRGVQPHRVTALLLSVGGLTVLYLTPLHEATAHHRTLHGLVELHFLLSGYLFAWVIAGPDPAARRPSVPGRLVVLGVAVAAHAILSQLMCAGVYVQVSGPVAQRLGAATLMYYGGDLAEPLLAVALVSAWRPGTGSARRTLSRPTSVA